MVLFRVTWDEAERAQITLDFCVTLLGTIQCCHVDMASQAHVSHLPPFLVHCGYEATLSSSVLHTQVTGNECKQCINDFPYESYWFKYNKWYSGNFPSEHFLLEQGSSWKQHRLHWLQQEKKRWTPRASVRNVNQTCYYSKCDLRWHMQCAIPEALIWGMSGSTWLSSASACETGTKRTAHRRRQAHWRIFYNCGSAPSLWRQWMLFYLQEFRRLLRRHLSVRGKHSLRVRLGAEGLMSHAWERRVKCVFMWGETAYVLFSRYSVLLEMRDVVSHMEVFISFLYENTKKTPKKPEIFMETEN